MKKNSNNKVKIKDCYFVGILVTLAVLVGVILWYNLYISPHQDLSNLGRINFDTQFPVPSDSHKDLLENADLHLKLHNSKLSVISMLVALLAAILTYIAFHVQYIYNKNQKLDLARERCENQYFHLLGVLRDMVNNMEVRNAGKGKRVMHFAFYEYKALFNKLKQRNICGSDKHSINKNAVMLWIDGVSNDFTPELKANETAPSEDTIKQLNTSLLTQQSRSVEGKILNIKYIADYQGLKIKFFDGHRLYFIPYFNYLIQILNFISDHKEISQKFDMLPYLYNEMSEHEIGLIYAYFNAYPDKAKGHEERLSKIYNSLSNDIKSRYLFTIVR